MAKQKKQAPAQYAPRQREIEYPKFARTAKVFSSTITPVQSGVFYSFLDAKIGRSLA
jgi:hypothetical protein